MPEITQINIQTKNKKRCNIFVDGEFFVAVSVETVLKNRLKVGQFIDAKDLQQVVEENDRSEAFSKSLDYVSKSLKTKRQVKDYLIRKGYSEEIAWYCVDKLKEYKFIDDKEYSKRYIESVSKNQGKRLTEYKLMMKGVRREDVESAYLETDIDANLNAKNVAEKYLKNKTIDKEMLAKTYRYLIGRGFSYEQASFAIKSFEKED